MPTLVIDNFGGALTRVKKGDINSGLAKYIPSHSYDCFSAPKNLTWEETPTQIDAAGSVISDLIVAMKERVESGIVYMYAVGSAGRVYKIQVTKPSTNDPNFDTPVLLATITASSPTFTRGGSISFFGATERIYIGHDIGVTRIDFAGTNEALVGSAGSYTANVPRPLEQFLGKLYFGNGSNIGEIDSTATVTTYTKLNPGFPSNTQVRDLDVTTDGSYLECVVTELALGSILTATPDPSEMTQSNSYVFKWNGTDNGYTAYSAFKGFSLTANHVFNSNAYLFGYDTAGANLFNPDRKILSPIFARSPMPNAINSAGNLVGWGTPEFSNGLLCASTFLYGDFDQDFGPAWYRLLRASAQGADLNVIKVPCHTLVTNLSFGASSNGYTSGVFGNGKIYYSTIETDVSNTLHYKLYKFFNVSTGSGTAAPGVYETQTQLFSKKIVVKQVRVYTEPFVANNAFTVALIGSSGNAITNGSYTFTAGTNVTVGDDMCQFNPGMNRTYALGLRITNSGSANWTCVKVEIDWEPAGK